MIKAVLFDAGGTLLTPHPSVGAVYAKVAARHGIKASPEQLNLRFKEVWKTNKGQGRLVDKAWWQVVVKHVMEIENGTFFEDLYAEFEKPDVWHVYPDVEPALLALTQRKMRLAVASNWDSRLPALLKKLGLDRHFERQFISYDLKVAKPDKRFFDFALRALGLDPLEVLHVGDDLVEDIEGAQGAGLRAYHIDRTHKPKNSRTLTSLDEILLRL